MDFFSSWSLLDLLHIQPILLGYRTVFYYYAYLTFNSRNILLSTSYIFSLFSCFGLVKILTRRNVLKCSLNSQYCVPSIIWALEVQMKLVLVYVGRPNHSFYFLTPFKLPLSWNGGKFIIFGKVHSSFNKHRKTSCCHRYRECFMKLYATLTKFFHI